MSRWLKREDRDLRRTVEAEGKAYRPDATIHVELHVVEAEVALDVFFSQGWEDHRADEGKSDLAAVGVAREHQVDDLAARMVDDGICVIGFMRHQNDRAIGVGGYGEIDIRAACTEIVRAAQPDAGSVAFNRDVLIDQDGSAVAGEGVDDERRTDRDVMIAEDGVAQGRGQGGENLSAAVGRVCRGDEGERAASDEVTCEKDEIGCEVIDLVDDALEEKGLCELVEVDVAELDDAIAVERVGQVFDGDGLLDGVEVMARNLA